MRLAQHVLALPAVGLALAGCATSVASSPESADAEASSTATAVVVVEGTSSNEGDHADAIARFVRAHGGVVDDDALRMVGAAVDFPALGACAPLTSRSFTSFHALSLVDVGGVSLLAGSSVVPLAARQLPDVADLVNGVVYSARLESPVSRGSYVVRVEGASELAIPAFAFGAVSPGAPDALHVAGEDGVAGAVPITANTNIDLTWTPLDGPTDDVVYVDVSGATGGTTTRCLFADTGAASLPPSALGTSEDGTISVHRLHRESFRAKGVDPGEVRFDFARVVTFVRR